MKFRYILICFVICCTTIFSQTWQNYNVANSQLPSDMVNKVLINKDGTVWFGTDNGVASLYDGNWKVYTTSDGLSSNQINGGSFLPKNSNELWLPSDNGSTSFEVNSTEISTEMSFINRGNSEILSDTLIDVDTDFWFNKWFATFGGLSIFTDAGTFNFNKENGLSVNKINDVEVIDDYWTQIATDGGGVVRLKYNGVDGISTASIIFKQWSLLASDTVLTVYVTDDTLRWYGTPQGVSTHFGEKTKDGPVTDGGSWWIYNTFTSGIIDNYCRSITRDNQNNMWFGTKGGLSKFNLIDSTWTSYTESDGLISNNIFDVEVDGDNNIWIATDKGVSKLTLVTDIEDDYAQIPSEFELKLDSYPNPFNPEINFKITLNKSSKVKIDVFSITGELVSSIANHVFNAGEQIIKWNAINNNNANSGIYIVRVISDYSIVSQKIVLLK